MPAGAMIQMNCGRSVTCRSGTGFLKFRRMVRGSTTVQSATIAMVGKTFLPGRGSAALRRLAATASAFSRLPLWNFTSLRSLSVTERLSGAIVQASAREGMALPSGVYSMRLS